MSAPIVVFANLRYADAVVRRGQGVLVAGQHLVELLAGALPSVFDFDILASPEPRPTNFCISVLTSHFSLTDNFTNPPMSRILLQVTELQTYSKNLGNFPKP